jgi:hypothetical protein
LLTLVTKGTVFVPPQNVLMPVQPSNFNSVNSHYGTPVYNGQQTPLQYPYQTMPTHQNFSPTPQPFYTPQPSPITVPPTTLPNPGASSNSSDLNRMLEVQSLMNEIHRLESESREGNQQRVQELKQRVGELNAMDGRMQGLDSLQPPPAYDGKQGPGRPEYGVAARG